MPGVSKDSYSLQRSSGELGLAVWRVSFQTLTQPREPAGVSEAAGKDDYTSYLLQARCYYILESRLLRKRPGLEEGLWALEPSEVCADCYHQGKIPEKPATLSQSWEEVSP